MTTSLELTWSVTVTGSCFHAAHAVYRGWPIADADLPGLVEEPLNALLDELSRAKAEEEAFWNWLLPAACRHNSVDELFAELNSRSAATRRLPVAPAARFVRRLQSIWADRFPNLEDELPYRLRPLREQFDARGPGLLNTARAALRQPPLTRAHVYLVHPVSGGGGGVHFGDEPGDKSVRIEGVLANPVPELPEVLRLTWLLAQLGGARPDSPEAEPTANQPHSDGESAAYRALLATLQAGEDLQLLQADAETVRMAIALWRCEDGPGANAGDDDERLLARWRGERHRG